MESYEPSRQPSLSERFARLSLNSPAQLGVLLLIEQLGCAMNTTKEVLRSKNIKQPVGSNLLGLWVGRRM